MSIIVLQSDGGREYIINTFKYFLLDKGIGHHMFCPYTPEQNGLAELKYKHIIETTITLLQTAVLPSSVWSGNKSPFEALFDVPKIAHFLIFGCSCFPLFRPIIVLNYNL